MSTVSRVLPAGLVVAAVLTGCGSPDEVSPPPSTSTPSTPMTTRLTAPPVEEPIGLQDRWMRPCALIDVWEPENLGFGETQGQETRAGGAALCTWAATDPKLHMDVRLEVAAYPDTDVLAQAYTQQDKAGFKPFTISRIPAVFLAEDSVCTFVVGLSERQGLKVTYGRAEPFETDVIIDRCLIPYQAALSAIDNLKR